MDGDQALENPPTQENIFFSKENVANVHAQHVSLGGTVAGLTLQKPQSLIGVFIHQFLNWSIYSFTLHLDCPISAVFSHMFKLIYFKVNNSLEHIVVLHVLFKHKWAPHDYWNEHRNLAYQSLVLYTVLDFKLIKCAFRKNHYWKIYYWIETSSSYWGTVNTVFTACSIQSP